MAKGHYSERGCAKGHWKTSPPTPEELEAWRSPRRDRLHARLRRLKPGGTTSLFAVEDERGHVQTDPAAISPATRCITKALVGIDLSRRNLERSAYLIH